ncbi:homeodomain-like superfamily protein [Striga asiatica]|uniref:Homeodomain-like superfamily protein n=1 Tax=Striga asiatica TaxID=4170 RepID=A0A5A7QKA1_STRAF|nr:homeodomain-like superfamily protein [Striga asiatica]
MASGSNGRPINEKYTINGHDDGQKIPRHPRWSRHETLVLIEGKNIVEAGGREGRKAGPISGPGRVEPKWDAISSYCKLNGAFRGPVQCRKRWSNLLSDFKKVKTWEYGVKDKGEEGESFWTMRSDLRRERRLPGFFDRVVYDVMENGVFNVAHKYQLALVTVNVDEGNNRINGMDGVEEEDEMEDEENNWDDLLSDFEQDVREEIGRKSGKGKVWVDGKMDGIPSPVPISEMKCQAVHAARVNQGNKREQGQNFWEGSESQEGVKRRRQSSGDSQNADVDNSLIKSLERTTNLLSAHLEEQKLSRQVEREQQKEQHGSLMAALGKIIDALEKIADKL